MRVRTAGKCRLPRPRQFPPSPAGPLAYFQHLQAAALTFVVTHTQGAVVTASFGPIYCYWRIEQELLHTVYSQQLTRWQGADILGHLLQILGQGQQGADHALLEKELLDFSTTLTVCPLPSTPFSISCY